MWEVAGAGGSDVSELQSCLCRCNKGGWSVCNPRVARRGAGKEEQRKRLRLELMRWHPDKFQARFAKRIAAGDRERVLERVDAQTKALNALAAKQKV